MVNAVETFFSALTRRRLKRGMFRSILDLQAAITATWTSTTRTQTLHLDQNAAQILAKLNPPNAPVL